MAKDEIAVDVKHKVTVLLLFCDYQSMETETNLWFSNSSADGRSIGLLQKQ